MNNFFEKLKSFPPHLLYSIAFVIVGILFVCSWSYFHYQELNIKKAEIARQQKEREQQQEDASTRESLRQYCLQAADEEYWSYIKLNGKQDKKKPGTYWAPQYVWDTAQKRKKEAIDYCFKQYPK